jgi:hypothetical protein
LGKYGTAIAHADTDPHGNAESDSIDLANAFCLADGDSVFQRDAFAGVPSADSSHVCIPDADALTLIPSPRERRRAFFAPQN